MKKIILLIGILPLSLRGQFKKPENPISHPICRHSCVYPAEEAYLEILSGNISSYIHDTVEYSIERRGSKYTKRYLTSDKTQKKVSNLLKKGKVKFVKKSNAGYVFTIMITSLLDDTEVLHEIKFKVDHFYQKITCIEISRGFSKEDHPSI